MKRGLNIVVALALIALLVGYMVTYTVRFNETVVVTTFGAADASGVKNAVAADGRAGSEAGLHFKLPWPVQRVAARYDTRVQVGEGVLEQITTADGQSVVVRFNTRWRVADPLEFYREIGSVDEAGRVLQVQARNALNAVSEYRFDELVNPDPRRVRLAELSQAVRARVQGQMADYGVEVLDVGVKTLALPGQVTRAVVERMAAETAAQADRALVEGQAEGRKLESEARATSDTLLSFAGRAASDIRAEGDQRAAALATRVAEDEGFAIYLSELDAIRQALGERTTFVIDADRLYPFTRLGEILRGGGQDREADGGGTAETPARAR